jgi:gliding motility-associated peptidyl-prolyl isomerase
MKNLHLFLIAVICCFSCKSPEPRMPENVRSGTFLKESAERSRKLNAAEQELIETIIANNPEVDYIASESGFWYFYRSKNTTDIASPQFGDVVDFEFNISNLEGVEIYPTSNRTYIIDKEELFTGLREGLKLMKPQEKVTFIFPSQKAFGYYGDDNKIGTNTPLICEVTLNSIIKTND